MSIYLSIVVPLYNEAESVDKLLNRIGTVAVADADPTNPKETTEVTLDGTNSSDADGTDYLLPVGASACTHGYAYQCCNGHGLFYSAGCWCGWSDPDFSIDGD